VRKGTSAATGNVPAEPTSFVGRRRELREVRRLLPESRLVTLTGTGGSGKTRLAVRVAAESPRAFPDGAWFVDLSDLPESGLLCPAAEQPDMLALQVADTLGLRERGGSPVGMVVRQLAGREMLLVLDNCEHLLPAAGILAGELLRGCPRLRIMATSREPLTTAGEVRFPVPPLPAPAPDQRAGLADMSRYESVALFLARARSAVPGFALTEDNHVAVGELCHRLDGLPLAIELAAARTRVLTPQQILDRLADRFRVLSRGFRNAPERQQTLRACVDWSFELCTKEERRLWARLSMFAGGFELDAAEGICADDELPGADLLGLLAGLVDKSILARDDVRDDDGDKPRYRMLQTIREYGQEKLDGSGENVALRRRHSDWYQRLVARACAEWVSDREAYWIARLGREHHNLRAVAEFSLTGPGEAEAVPRIAVSLPWLYWRAGGVVSEGRRWLDRSLARVTGATALRARALVVQSHLAAAQGDTAAAARLLDEGEELARRLGAGNELALVAFLRGLRALYANDLVLAVKILEPARETLSRAPDQYLFLYLNVLVTLCSALGLAGDHEGARACLRDTLRIVEPRGARYHRSLALFVGGLAAWLRGDLREAAEQELECLRLKRAWDSDDRHGTAQSLEVLAWATAGRRQHRRAATLLGAADALWTDIGMPVTALGHIAGEHVACEERIRAALGDAEFTGAFQHGRTLTHDAAIAYALDGRRPAPAPRQDPLTPLTRREQEVAELIAQGLSNKDIAATLVISTRTAESHAEHILAKLGFASRAQVAGWAAARPGNPSDPAAAEPHP
jgi:predicted ATPase/DNA-binding NarL/FixJ family response regulator